VAPNPCRDQRHVHLCSRIFRLQSHCLLHPEWGLCHLDKLSLQAGLLPCWVLFQCHLASNSGQSRWHIHLRCGLWGLQCFSLLRSKWRISTWDPNPCQSFSPVDQSVLLAFYNELTVKPGWNTTLSLCAQQGISCNNGPLSRTWVSLERLSPNSASSANSRGCKIIFFP